MNPLFNLLNGGRNQIQFGPAKMMNEFKQFAESFHGDPRMEVQRLLQSGTMNQQQLNELQQAAQEFSRFFGK